MSSDDLHSCVREWVARFGEEKGIDTSRWQTRVTGESELAVCGIPSREMAKELAELVKSECATEPMVLDRHPNLPHWCVMCVATMLEEKATDAAEGCEDS